MDVQISEMTFGGGSFTPLRGELRVGGRLERLRPRTAAVLACLLAHRGRIVGREELMREVWPDVVVTDDSLAQCIKEIRHALGPAADCIRTVPRVGYGFAEAAAEPAASPAPSPTASSAHSSTSPNALARRSLRSRWWLAAAALGLAGAAAVGVALLLTPARHSPLPLSVVVLPLANLSGDAEQDYLAEALTSDITTDLTRMRGSFVIARNTAARFKGRQADAAAVAREIGVSCALTGNVRRIDERVRLNLNLVEAATGRQIWAERFDADRSHIAALQVRVTDSLARTLQIELMGAEAARSKRERAQHPDAYDLAIRGWVLWNRQRPESVAAARELVLQAVALDPDSALAWGTLSATYLADILNRWMHLRGHSREEWVRRHEQAATKAQQLDPDYIGPSCTVAMLRKRFEESLACRERMIERFPNDPLQYHMAAQVSIALGQSERALVLEREAMRVSPSDTRLHNFHGVLAAAHSQLAQFGEALAMAKRSVQLDADYGLGQGLVAAAAAQLGAQDKAEAALRQYLRLMPKLATLESVRADALSDRPAYLAAREHYLEGLRKAGLPP